MSKLNVFPIKARFFIFAIWSMLIASGLSFYASYREGSWLNQLWLTQYFEVPGFEFNAWLLSSFPSFVFVLIIVFTGLLLSERMIVNARRLIISAVLFVSLTELLQFFRFSLDFSNTFDFRDVLAAFAGGLVSYFMVYWMKRLGFLEVSSNSNHKPVHLYFLAMLAFGGVLGSTYCDECDAYCDDFPSDCVEPVFMTLDELRTEIQPELGDSVTLKRAGKIYLISDHLLIVDNYRGIHIFDNVDPLNPMRIAFIPLPGVTEVSVRGAFLYANSFMDLVTINLDQLLDGSFSNASFTRQLDQFERPYRYQFVPSGYRFRNGYLIPNDEGDDIVIGYKTRSGEEVLYGDNNE